MARFFTVCAIAAATAVADSRHESAKQEKPKMPLADGVVQFTDASFVDLMSRTISNRGSAELLHHLRLDAYDPPALPEEYTWQVRSETGQGVLHVGKKGSYALKTEMSGDFVAPGTKLTWHYGRDQGGLRLEAMNGVVKETDREDWETFYPKMQFAQAKHYLGRRSILGEAMHVFGEHYKHATSHGSRQLVIIGYKHKEDRVPRFVGQFEKEGSNKQTPKVWFLVDGMHEKAPSVDDLALPRTTSGEPATCPMPETDKAKTWLAEITKNNVEEDDTSITDDVPVIALTRSGQNDKALTWRTVADYKAASVLLCSGMDLSDYRRLTVAHLRARRDYTGFSNTASLNDNQWRRTDKEKFSVGRTAIYNLSEDGGKTHGRCAPSKFGHVYDLDWLARCSKDDPIATSEMQGDSAKQCAWRNVRVGKSVNVGCVLEDEKFINACKAAKGALPSVDVEKALRKSILGCPGQRMSFPSDGHRLRR